MSAARPGRLAAAVLTVVVVACERPPAEPPVAHRPRATPTSANTLVVGLVATLTGPDAWRGEDAFEGADLAVQVLNRLRPEGAPRFELVTLDDGGNEAEAAELVRGLATSDRTMGVVYAGPPLGLPSAGSSLVAAGIPAFLCHGDLFSAGLLRGNLFQMAAPYAWQARKLMAYAAGDRNYRRVGVLAPAGGEGGGAVRSLRAAAAPSPARVTVSRYVGEQGLGRAVERLEAARVSAIIVDGSPPLLARLFEHLRADDNDYETTRAARRAPLRRTIPWRPQVLAFDPAIAPRPPGGEPFVGTVASDTYARGAAFVRVPSFLRFRASFREWWAHEPLGWQQRAYDATRLIGWAVERSRAGRAGVATAVETVIRERFGGTDVTFSRADHVAVDEATVGLWTIPRPGAARSPVPGLRWVPLARGFSTGLRTHVPPGDRPFLYRGAGDGSRPVFRAFRYGVTSGPSDRVH